MDSFPSKIICLTEETVETLYLLGRSDLIIGVSEYVERPPEAKTLPVVSQFIRSDIDKITNLAPDLVIGFSDIQKDIARDLISRGLNVYITNQRSLEEILSQIEVLGRIIGEQEKSAALVKRFRQKIEAISERARKLKSRPKVYFEEWDHPRLSSIRWVSELITVCGGESIFSERVGSLAKEREVFDDEIIKRNPDIILASWCGKKVKIDSIKSRKGYSEISAIKNNQIYDLPSAIFLQPGPALFVDGLDQLIEIFEKSFHP